MQKDYWLHRISHHMEVSHSLLEDRNILSIGFSDFSDREFIKNSNDRDKFNKAFKDCWGRIPRTRHNLWRFIYDMKKGDFVLVPRWGEFAIYEIETDCFSNEDLDIKELKDWNDIPIIKNNDGYLIFDKKDNKKVNYLDLGFYRKVKKITPFIERDKFADSALTARMKMRQTNADISDLNESIENAITSCKKNKPINLHALVTEKNRENTFSTIKAYLTPDKLERLVKWYFEKCGCTEAYIPPKNEKDKKGDADVTAIFEPIKTIIHVQVKFHEGETDEWALEQIENYKRSQSENDDGYLSQSWVISTGDFSKKCVKIAGQKAIQLINGKEFTEMLLEVGISSDVENALSS